MKRRETLWFRVVTEKGLGTPKGAPLNYFADPAPKGWTCCGGPVFDTPRRAVTDACAYLGIIEIRGPGELTTAEQLAALRAELCPAPSVAPSPRGSR